MRCHRIFQRGCLLLAAAGLGIPSIATLAVADSVPESIRIQEKAEKAYERAPVVPIERGNAHHRDSKDEGDGAGNTPEPPARGTPQGTERHNSNN